MEYRKLSNRIDDIDDVIRTVQNKWNRGLSKDVISNLNKDHSFRGCCAYMSKDLVDELKKRGIHSEVVSLANEPEYARFMPKPPHEEDHYGVKLDDGTILDISINQFVPDVQVLERYGIQKIIEYHSDIWDFIDSLNPDDVGTDTIDGNVIHYEGYTNDCWDDAEACKLSIKELENETLSEWEKKEGMKATEFGWKYGEPMFGDETVFYAIFSNKD